MSKTQTRRQPDKARTGRNRKKRSRKNPPPTWYQRYPWLPWVMGLGIAAVLVVALRSGGADAPTPGESATNPVVGPDLHSLVVDPTAPDTLYIGSHQGVSVSSDGGANWEVIETLNGADAMGWAFNGEQILVGGHPGISVSTDGGNTFEQRNDGLPATDVHALGAGEEIIYAGLAGLGTVASTDGGVSWETRSEEFGGAFMGAISVDPSDDDHLIAPDMQQGAVESRDGGRTWRALGGVPAAMWVSWDRSDTDHIIATTQGAAAETTDGGQTWTELEIPDGASIVEFSPDDPDILYAAVLDDPEARVFSSTDGGTRWEQL